MGLTLFPPGATLATTQPRIDILLMGDGYGRLDRFRIACQRVVSGLFLIEPFRTLRNHINVFVDFQPSASVREPFRWISNGKLHREDVGLPFWRSAHTTTDRTRFGLYFESGKDLDIFSAIDTGIVTDHPDRITQHVSALRFESTTPSLIVDGKATWLARESPSYGLVCVLVPNHRTGGTRHDAYFTLSVGDDQVGTFAHELGHALLFPSLTGKEPLGLGDEYESKDEKQKNGTEISYERPPDYVETTVNVVKESDFTDRVDIKFLLDTEIELLPWKDLLSIKQKQDLRAGTSVYPHALEHILDSRTGVVDFLEPDIDEVPQIGRMRPGSYSPEDLGREIRDALNSGGRQRYEVSFVPSTPSSRTGRIVLESTGTFQLDLSNYTSAVFWLFVAANKGRSDTLTKPTNRLESEEITEKTPMPNYDLDLQKATYEDIGLVEGGDRYRRGMWRTNHDCVMRQHTAKTTARFCKVCRLRLMERIGGRTANFTIGQ